MVWLDRDRFGRLRELDREFEVMLSSGRRFQSGSDAGAAGLTEGHLVG